MKAMMVAVAVTGAVMATISWAISSDDGNGDIPPVVSAVCVLMIWFVVLLAYLVLMFLADFHRFRRKRRRQGIASERPRCDSPG
jgi:hypothetical protein